MALSVNSELLGGLVSTSRYTKAGSRSAINVVEPTMAVGGRQLAHGRSAYEFMFSSAAEGSEQGFKPMLV